MARKERYIVGLDVGTSKVTAIVAEPAAGQEELDIVGMGVAESHGIRRGVVVNLEAAVESIKKAIDEAELTAGIEIDTVYLALSGPHIKGFNSRGVVAVAGKNREIAREDVRRAIEAAKAVSLPGGRRDPAGAAAGLRRGRAGRHPAPTGMTGARLEVNVHIVTGGVTATQNLIACVNRAGVQVSDIVLGQLAASHAVLTPDEKELGVCAGRHRRRHDGPGDLRARQSVAHGRHRRRRRSLHQRHRGRAADADPRGREAQAPQRLRPLGHGGRGGDDRGRQRGRAAAAGDGAPDPLRDPAAPRRGDLPPGLGRDSAAPATRSP